MNAMLLHVARELCVEVPDVDVDVVSQVSKAGRHGHTSHYPLTAPQYRDAYLLTRPAARSAAGALVIWLHDEGVLREGVVVELLDAHRVSDLTLAVDGSVDDRGLRIGAADGVDHVGAPD